MQLTVKEIGTGPTDQVEFTENLDLSILKGSG
jgi:hypothetical protein